MENREIKKIDIGCGRNKRAGFIGVDNDSLCAPDVVASALELPFEDGTVDEVYSSHLVEHFYPEEARKFFDEIFRVLKKDGIASIKIDRDWTKGRLMRKDSTHKYRYTAQEIDAMLAPFREHKAENRIYSPKFPIFRQKIFVDLKK